MFTKLRRVRKMTYVLWAWCLLIVAWAIASANNVAHTCAANSIDTSTCNTGKGTAILLVLFIGFVGFLFFSIIWFMSRPRGDKA